MAESSTRVWIAVTNHQKFVLEADTYEQAAALFEEKLGYAPQAWQLESMDNDDPSS